MPLPYVNIFDLDIPVDDFDFNHYIDHEVEILKPALERKGYILLGQWYSTEVDSFGPLSRGVYAEDPNNKRVILWYG
jgi:hypothetical protein